MSETLPPNLRVVVFGGAAPDAAWLAHLRADLGSRAIETCAAREPLAALRSLALPGKSDDVLLLEAGARLPRFWLARLLKAYAASDADVLSPLGNANPDLSPLAEGEQSPEFDPASVDAGCFAYSARALVPTLAWLRSCAIWRASAVAWLHAHPEFAGPALPPTLRGALLDHLFVGDGKRPHAGPRAPADPRFPPPASPLASLRARYAPLSFPRAANVGLDARPVVLHVLHGWGGGVEAFVRDLAETDDAHAHLALIARGNFGRRSYGESLELALPAADFAVIARWPLPRPIAATVEHDASYRAILAEIVARHAVDAVIVSSLIGHSLDALATGKPTQIVMHDYYPLWPMLHCDFGDVGRRFDPAELDAELATARDGFPFAERDAETWWSLRRAYLAALARAHASLIAPSESVRDNLARLAPELAARTTTTIPHGFRPFSAHLFEWSPPPRARPRVLVLGRITGGKGETLLAAIAADVARFADLYLLGCGKAGEAFFGRSGVHVEMDYARDELPAHIARIAPDLALIPATVAETFSYTLSELWALGVPVLATRLGSLAERIAGGDDGWLVDAEPKAVVAALRERLADRAALAAMRSRLAGKTQRTLAQMANDHGAALAFAARPLARYPMASVAPGDLHAAETAQALQRLSRKHAEAEITNASQLREMLARGEWAHGLARDLRERTAWAMDLQAETQRLTVAVAERHAAVEALAQELRERWAEHLDAERAWEFERVALQHRQRELEADLELILGSRSWQLTKPLRFAARASRTARTWLAFRIRQFRQILGRFHRSLRMRGVGGTVARMAREFSFTRHARIEVSLPDLPADTETVERFAVPASDAPRVSLVIPVYNQFRHTLTCLKSLADHPGTVPFETIVVDDCSSDETAARLPGIGGVRVIRNAENLGFIGACNVGAAAARGEFVVLLNNDTAVQPGWLEALCATFDNFADCGLAGAKLVYPDGRLQEAGGIVFSDGSGWNYGRDGDAADPSVEYVREVDYCSGAAIMIRRALFERFGGFDTRYAPAYYEDTDLAFRVREAGLKVYYQPAALVVHFEGVSSGTDTASGIKRYQLVNQEKFVARWAEALARQPRPGTPIPLAREHRVRGRVLIVDAYVPEPDQDSGSVRLVNLMKLLIALGWKVIFAPDNRAYVERYSADLQQLGVEVLYHPAYADPVAWFSRNGPLLDAVFVLRHYLAVSYLPLVRQYAPRARMIFDTVDLHYLREDRLAALNDDPDMRRIAAKTKVQELKIVRGSDVTLVVSPVEQELLKLECPGARVEVLSNVHALVGARKPFSARSDLWFVGGFQHPPNLDAMQWFVGEVWPRIARALPAARFHIVGSKMPESIRALAGERVIAHGHVPDLDAFLDDCRIAVAPLRYGAGVKGKVNQSMAHGQPVVATPVAVEGMRLVEGEEALVAATPEEFAAAVVRLYHDEALWNRLSSNGLENVRRHFSFDVARAALTRILPA